MSRVPRLLPLIGVAAAGVLAVNAMSGAETLPALVSGARAFAADAIKPKASPQAAATGEKAGAKATNPADMVTADPATAGAETAPSAAEAGADAANGPAGAKPAPVCAPTAAELAKAAGLSPAELQVMQSLGARRGQLDKRESDLSTQLALLAAAEAKVDAKLKALTAVKTDIKGLIGQADAKEQAEVDRMVKVFETMKPKDAAPRMVLLDDSVRLPIAAKMKEKSLSGVLAQMPPAEAKKLTEALSRRFNATRAIAAAAADKAGVPTAATASSAPTTAPAGAKASPDPTVSPDPTQPPPKAKAKSKIKAKSKLKGKHKLKPKIKAKPTAEAKPAPEPPSLPRPGANPS